MQLDSDEKEPWVQVLGDSSHTLIFLLICEYIQVLDRAWVPGTLKASFSLEHRIRPSEHCSESMWQEWKCQVTSCLEGAREPGKCAQSYSGKRWEHKVPALHTIWFRTSPKSGDLAMQIWSWKTDRPVYEVKGRVSISCLLQSRGSEKPWRPPGPMPVSSGSRTGAQHRKSAVISVGLPYHLRKKEKLGKWFKKPFGPICAFHHSIWKCL